MRRSKNACPVFLKSGRRRSGFPQAFRSRRFQDLMFGRGGRTSYAVRAGWQDRTAFRRAPGKHEALKKSRVLLEDPGRKYRIELSPNYFLYLIAVPISLTVTVLIPQMQFIL